MAEGRLWVCYDCKMIGSEEEADQHMIESGGHGTSMLTQEETDGVRELWEQERNECVAGLIGWARLRHPEVRS